MKEYVLSTGAELDLDEIWEYIALDNIRAADRWVGKLFECLRCFGAESWNRTQARRPYRVPDSLSGRWALT